MAYRDWGSKTGGGGVASKEHEELARKERLRQLAMDTVDLKNDPYFMRNHLGTYECKLCLTLHANEGNYLAHTQGRRHQSNLKRRAAMESQKEAAKPRAPLAAEIRTIMRKRHKIGTPGYQITKQRDPSTGQLSLLFQIRYPQIAEGLQPRHRFMSAFEQKKERPDRRYQYLLFAAEPYETVAFKIPNLSIDKSEGRFYTNWDRDGNIFTLQLFFEKLGGRIGEQSEVRKPADTLQPEKQPKPRDPFAGIVCV
ncbi:Splicing factor 3A subunit 2 [Gracilariopsis chorda]|uniref:Splicing factor 3A subunit 2 n=1 Tax=Gracilariopsis chorda TaxID=448386 RepID=A0A2V3J307_9FLOR|nr:Splicing factor 3A subunit 2 [Gracilariopsis chorda]|eukprot:PXF48831.1 Splicing factor 3A subunit 2 [Gracilariopsis chorda]